MSVSDTLPLALLWCCPLLPDCILLNTNNHYGIWTKNIGTFWRRKMQGLISDRILIDYCIPWVMLERIHMKNRCFKYHFFSQNSSFAEHINLKVPESSSCISTGPKDSNTLHIPISLTSFTGFTSDHLRIGLSDTLHIREKLYWNNWGCLEGETGNQKAYTTMFCSSAKEPNGMFHSSC